jgi:hypothetical protein
MVVRRAVTGRSLLEPAEDLGVVRKLMRSVCKSTQRRMRLTWIKLIQ